MADREEIVEIFSELRNFADNDVHPVVSPENWHVYSKLCDLIDQAKEYALAMLKEQEPKTPIHIHEEYPEHDWRTDEDGEIDEWAMEDELHHGPACKRCGYSFCVHCKPNGWNEKPCVIDYYQCPRCRKRIFKDDGKTLYCEKCGQGVNWND